MNKAVASKMLLMLMCFIFCIYNLPVAGQYDARPHQAVKKNGLYVLVNFPA
jgi:hypothetical protein